MAISMWFNYRRAAHPDRVPPVLPADSPLALRLSRVKRGFVWTGGLSFCASIASVFLFCACEMESTLAILPFALPMAIAVASLIGYTGVERYLRERTMAPLSTSVGWPGRRRSSSDFKPFYSEHWGERTISGDPLFPETR